MVQWVVSISINAFANCAGIYDCNLQFREGGEYFVSWGYFAWGNHDDYSFVICRRVMDLWAPKHSSPAIPCSTVQRPIDVQQVHSFRPFPYLFRFGGTCLASPPKWFLLPNDFYPCPIVWLNLFRRRCKIPPFLGETQYLSVFLGRFCLHLYRRQLLPKIPVFHQCP